MVFGNYLQWRVNFSWVSLECGGKERQRRAAALHRVVYAEGYGPLTPLLKSTQDTTRFSVVELHFRPNCLSRGRKRY